MNRWISKDEYKDNQEAECTCQFKGWRNKAVATINYMLEYFPEDIELLKNAGVYCLEYGADQKAKKYFLKVEIALLPVMMISVMMLMITSCLHYLSLVLFGYNNSSYIPYII